MRVIDIIEKHEIEIARLHDAHIAAEALAKARSAGWGWIGAIAGSVIGSLITAALISLWR